MKELLVVLCLALSLNSMADNRNKFFCSTVINLGNIPSETDSCVAYLSYWNRTGHDTVIESVHTTCGCTKVKYTEHPISKNQTGIISIIVNLSYETGHFEKTAVFYVSGIQPTIIKIIGNIIHSKQQ